MGERARVLTEQIAGLYDPKAHEFYKSRGYEVVKSQYRLGKRLV